MKRSLIVVAGILVFVLLTSGGGIITRNSSNALLLAPCYHAQVSTDNSLLEITKYDGISVSGNLIQQHFQKDSSFGTFKGKFINNQLTATYSFYSEGQLTDRDVIFNKSGKTLDSEGYKYLEAKDCSKITYSQGLSLIPVSTKLPLHLFPKLRITSPDPAGFTFMKHSPIAITQLMFKTSKGDWEGLINYYLWDINDWQDIYNPNEAPDFGYEKWSDSKTVLTVSGPQDCIYEDKGDCSAVTEISGLMYLSESYLKTVY
jgi:hypothetical protein